MSNNLNWVRGLRPPGFVFWVVTGVLILAFASVLAIGITRAPLGYDEAYNLQVPSHLATSGQYATNGSLYGGNDRPFDTFISTGPTVLLPIGAAFWLIGPHVWVARVIPTLGYLLLVLATWRLGIQVGGRWAGLVGAASLLSFNTVADWPYSSFYGPGDVLGEYTATAFVLVAALRLRWSSRAAGVWIGLAALTKVLAVISLPAFCFAAWVGSRRANRPRLDEVIRLVAGAAIPIVIWHAIRLLALGPKLYAERVGEFTAFFATAGSGIAGQLPSSIMSRLEQIYEYWYLAPLHALLVLPLIFAALSRRQLRRTAAEPPRMTSPDYMASIALVGTVVLAGIWWVFLSKGMGRHVLIPMFIATPLAFVWAVRAVRSEFHRGRRLVSCAAAVALMGACTAQACLHVRDALQPPGVTLTQQMAASRHLRSASIHTTLHVGWWQNPELAFLSGTRSRPLGEQPGVLVLDPLQRVSDPKSYESARQRCRATMYEQDGYIMCRTGP